MSNRLHRARSGCDGLLFPVVVHRSLSSHQQQLSSEIVFSFNMENMRVMVPNDGRSSSRFLHFGSMIDQQFDVSSQDDFKGYKKKEICTALLDVCPPDPATLRNCHQDQKTQTQHNVLRSMFPSGTGALQRNVQSCVNFNTRCLKVSRADTISGISKQLNMTQD